MKHRIIVLLLIAIITAGCSSAAVTDTAPPLVETGIDPDTWALVPAGEFLMGLHAHETLVDYDYKVMVTDVTNVQYANYLNQALAEGTIKITDTEITGFYPGDIFHGYNHEEEISSGEYQHVPLTDDGLRIAYDGDTFRAKAGYENHPMVMVTWFGAKAYCDFYDWRLPTEIEWEKAARGTDGRPFPWGSELERNNANFYSSHDLFEKIMDGLNDTTPVGFFNGNTYEDYQTLDSPSPYGIYDMAGNVWQWTGDVYENQHYRYMRGGSKADYGYNLRVWTRNNAGPEYFGPSVGFRCAKD